MKLSVNFDDLWANVRKMGAEKSDFTSSEVWYPPPINPVHRKAKLEEVKAENGLLSIDGSQVLLYIPDHSKWVSGALQTPRKGNKFHIADCKKLQEMRSQGKYNRYMVTNNLSDTFNIYGTDGTTGNAISGEVKLNVCKQCLNYLNYKGADHASIDERNRIVREFDIGEFFSTYSSLFEYMPEGLAGTGTGYTDNWKEISRRTRRTAHFTCSHCHLDLSDYPELLHVHHANGIKHNNSAANLKVLCCDCHRKEPLHDHMFISHQQTQLINRLRHEQGIILSGYEDWDKVFQYADPALYGILGYARAENYAPPHIGHKLESNRSQTLVELDAAWPKTKFGIYIDKPKEYKNTGWYLLNIKEAMDYFCQKK
ncbi:hypothetical protein CI610_01521 [invertebrate metagenome]|uniref:HNH nuclease domain-containing protein n=1 Tax=invertebrate metagenome TaxID=1711999 RepID=A0A2H9T8F0_9ZZZZ